MGKQSILGGLLELVCCELHIRALWPVLSFPCFSGCLGKGLTRTFRTHRLPQFCLVQQCLHVWRCPGFEHCGLASKALTTPGSERCQHIFFPQGVKHRPSLMLSPVNLQQDLTDSFSICFCFPRVPRGFEKRAAVLLLKTFEHHPVSFKALNTSPFLAPRDAPLYTGL